MRPDPFPVLPFPDLRRFKPQTPTSKRLRVCIATEEVYGPVRNGGIASTYYHLAQLLAEDGHDVTILYLKGKKSEIGSIEHWIDFYDKLGVKFVPLPLVPAEGPTQWQRRHFSAYVWLKNRDVPFDVVHASEWRGGVYYALLAKHMGIAFADTVFLIKASSPHIWNRHYMMDFLSDIGLLGVMFPEQRSIELADMVIGGSAHLLNFMSHVGYHLPPGRTYVQPNVLRFEDLNIIDKRDDFSFGDRVKTKDLVFFGRLEARKGLEIFCDALDFLVTRNVLPDQVTFLGKAGNNLPSTPALECTIYIKKRARKWPFEIEIISDYQQTQALSYLLEKPRIAVMPSLIENSTMAVYETLIYKIPFIATAVGGTPELIRDDDVEQVLTEANPRSLAEKLQAALTDGGYVARCSFDNEENLQVWRNFHEYLAERKASGSLHELYAPTAVLQKPSIGLCLFSNGDVEELFSLVDQAVFAADDALLDISVAATEVSDEMRTLAAETDRVTIRIVDAHELSLGEAWNAAAAASEADAYLFLRCDIHMPLQGFSGILQTAFSSSAADALSCVWRKEKQDGSSGTVVVPIGPDLAFAVVRRDTLSGGGVAVTAKKFNEIDGFNPIFGMGGIEQDLLVRAARDGTVDVVPEALYFERPGRSKLTLNQINAQYMAVSSLIDDSPYNMKRMHLVHGYLRKGGLPEKFAHRDSIVQCQLSSASFINASPLPKSGYDNRPRLRVLLGEPGGAVDFSLDNHDQPAKLDIFVDDKLYETIECSTDSDGSQCGRWSLKRIVGNAGDQPMTVVAKLSQERPGGPQRTLTLAAISSTEVAVASIGNFIEPMTDRPEDQVDVSSIVGKAAVWQIDSGAVEAKRILIGFDTESGDFKVTLTGRALSLENPELEVVINGTKFVQAFQSLDSVPTAAFRMTSDLLKEGSNRIRFSVVNGPDDLRRILTINKNGNKLHMVSKAKITSFSKSDETAPTATKATV